jgi:ubiquinone/menaquinone biosynthesis C-methylase UbiE
MCPEMVAGTGQRMPFKKSSFDVIYDHYSLPFANVEWARLYPDAFRKAISRYLRVLKPGGKMIFTMYKGDARELARKLDFGSLKQAIIKLVPVDETPYKIRGKIIRPNYPAQRVFIIEKKKA